MSIAKVIEVLAEGDSVEAAVESAVAEASKTVKNIRSAYVNDIQAIVRDNKVAKYRVNVKLSFIVEVLWKETRMHGFHGIKSECKKIQVVAHFFASFPEA